MTFSRGSHAMYNDGYQLYTPEMLFSSGEIGAWYDPSDFTTVFQDSFGVTPVTAAGQSVGLVLDKSQSLALGSEFITNLGTQMAARNANSTITSSSTTQVIVASAAAGNFGAAIAAGGAVVGATYLLSLTITSSVNRSIGIAIGGTARTVTFTAGVPQSLTFYLGPAAFTTGLDVYATASGASETITIANVSQRRLAGNHAFQATALNRPTFGRNPITGIRNQFTYTEQLNNAAWTKSGVSVTPDATTAPDGTLTADLIIPSATATMFKQATQSFNYTLNTNYTYSGYFKADTYRYVQILTSATSFGGGYINYDLVTGTETLYSSSGTPWTLISKSITSVGNGWYRIAVTLKCINSIGGNFAFNPIPAANSVRGVSWAGDGTSGFFVWGQQFEISSAVTAYQKVVSSFDVTESGVPECYYLQFDGSDDFLVTSTITPGTDKIQLFVGQTKLSDAAQRVVIELGTPLATGGFTLQSPSVDPAANKYLYTQYGTATAELPFVTGSQYAAPQNTVITGYGDIAADINLTRINGTQVASGTADQGTGNFGSGALYIGRRGGTTLPFNGRIYSIILRFGSNLTTTRISEIETWVTRKTGAY